MYAPPQTGDPCLSNADCCSNKCCGPRDPDTPAPRGARLQTCRVAIRGDMSFRQTDSRQQESVESPRTGRRASSQLAASRLLRNPVPQPARGSGAGMTRKAAKAAKEEQPRASALGTKPIQQRALTGRHRTKAPPTRGAFTKAALNRPAGCDRKSALGRSGNSHPVPSSPWLTNPSPSLISTCGLLSAAATPGRARFGEPPHG